MMTIKIRIDNPFRISEMPTPEISSKDFDHQTWKYIRSGALPHDNAELMKKYLTRDQHIAFVNDALTLPKIAFELLLVRFVSFSATRKQRILDIWFLFDEAITWAGSKDPEGAAEFIEMCEQARDRLLAMAWGRATR